VETDKLIMFTAANATHISADMKAAPYAHSSDGCWDIVIVNDVPKTTLLKLFLAMENGGNKKREKKKKLFICLFRPCGFARCYVCESACIQNRA
jgi:diacylglycerol kinase family enzyme